MSLFFLVLVLGVFAALISVLANVLSDYFTNIYGKKIKELKFNDNQKIKFVDPVSIFVLVIVILSFIGISAWLTLESEKSDSEVLSQIKKSQEQMFPKVDYIKIKLENAKKIEFHEKEPKMEERDK